MHVTADALLVHGTEILLVEHRAYGIFLQPGFTRQPPCRLGSVGLPGKSSAVIVLACDTT